MPSEGSGGGMGAAGGSAVPHQQRKPISWTKGELVGQGAFGSVFVAMDNDTGELIAVKQVRAHERWVSMAQADTQRSSQQRAAACLQLLARSRRQAYLLLGSASTGWHPFYYTSPGACAARRRRACQESRGECPIGGGGGAAAAAV